MPPQTEAVGVILAAGYGTRMRPLTDAVPKPLLPFLNTPIIAYTIDHMVRAGIRHIGINTHHLAEALRAVVERVAFSYKLQGVELTITWSHEDAIQGTAGGVAGVWEAMGRPQQTLVAINGDPVMNVDLADALATHRSTESDATILVRPRLAEHPGGVLTAANGHVAGLRKARAKGLEGEHERDFMGVHILEPNALKDLEQRTLWADEATCMVGDFYIPRMNEGHTLHTILIDDFWTALDTPKLLLDATRQVLDNPSLFKQFPFDPNNPHKLWVATPQNTNRKTMFAPPVLLGLYAATQEGSRIGTHSVIDGCTVHSNATVSNAVLFGMGNIEGTWENCVAVNGKIAQL